MADEIEERPEGVPKPLSPYILFMKALKNDEDFKQMMADKGIKKNYLEEASKKWNDMNEE